MKFFLALVLVAFIFVQLSICLPSPDNDSGPQGSTGVNTDGTLCGAIKQTEDCFSDFKTCFETAICKLKEVRSQIDISLGNCELCQSGGEGSGGGGSGGEGSGGEGSGGEGSGGGGSGGEGSGGEGSGGEGSGGGESGGGGSGGVGSGGGGSGGGGSGGGGSGGVGSGHRRHRPGKNGRRGSSDGRSGPLPVFGRK